VAKTQYLTYIVHLTDEALVASLNAQYPNGVIRAPYNPVGPGGMAVEAANLAGVTGPLPVLNEGDAFVSPSLTSGWFTNSNTFPRDVATFTISSGWWIFGSSTKFYWVARFVYSPALTGASGMTPPDPDAPPDSGSGPVETDTEYTNPAPIPSRYFIDGFEILEFGEGAFNSGAGRGYSRAGAVADDGLGFAYRNGGASALTRTHQFSTVRNYAWNRFYVRLRKNPNVTTEIFRVTTASTATGGARLAVAADGKLAMYVTDGTTLSLVSVTDGQLTVGKRQKIDVLTYIGDDGTGVATCVCYYFLDGKLVGSSTSSPGGLVGNARVLDQRLGQSQSLASTLEIDFDDWRCSTVPDDKLFRKAAYSGASTYVLGDLVTYTGTRPKDVPMPQIGFEMFRARGAVGTNTPPRSSRGVQDTTNWERVTDSTDWLLGSRIVLLDNTAFASSANWTGDYRQASSPLTRAAATAGLTSSTSAAVVAMTTNALTRLRDVRGAQGWAAVNVGVQSNKTAAAADGSVGYKIGGAAAVYTTITGESTAGDWSSALYAPSGLQAPEAFAAVEAHYKKGADANASRVRCLMASVEILGVFTDCDVARTYDQATGSWIQTPNADALPLSRGTHNAPYWDTPWFLEANPPLSPVVIKVGTYVGNGTGQDLTFSAPPHLILIRPTSGDAGGARYFSSAPNVQHATNIGAGQDLGPGYARRDPSFVPSSSTADQQMQFIFSIAGSDTQINANAVTYQYVALCDPGARFLLNGATYHEAATGLLPTIDSLEVSNFLAEFGLFWRFDFSNTSTDELWTKGGGHTTAQASKSGTGTPVASALTFGSGTLTSDTGFVDTTSRFGTVYALFRRDDGNNVSGKVVQTGTYVGDGNASRSIPFSPAPGTRPIYAVVQPHNAAAIHRDPAHTGTTSSQVNNGSANAATGITAGAVDSFTVGSALNANGVTYSWLAIVGATSAGNNGWGASGAEYTPVPSDSPIDPTYTPDADPDDTFPPSSGDDGDSGGGSASSSAEEPDFDESASLPNTTRKCSFFTQKVANIALSHLGVSQQIVDVVDENTQEAILVRLHFKDCVDATLRDFDWPLATAYAALVLVTGSEDTPANKDWTYAYRAPTDMVKARRLVTSNGRKWDPAPIAWRLGTDANGALIYSNQESTSDDVVTLEYTVRLACPSYTLDAEFRAALAWRLAHTLAMPLSRDSKKQTQAWAMYQSMLPKATETAANEQQQELDDDADAAWIAGR
jgi:hypothetical protein